MARLKVVQIRCDRCKRVELIPPPKDEKVRADFEVRFLDKTLKYDDLCSSCKEAIDHIWDDIKEWKREIKQQFGPSVPENQAVPLSPAPDYTPPKPHSVAATKK